MQIKNDEIIILTFVKKDYTIVVIQLANSLLDKVHHAIETENSLPNLFRERLDRYWGTSKSFEDYQMHFHCFRNFRMKVLQLEKKEKIPTVLRIIKYLKSSMQYC